MGCRFSGEYDQVKGIKPVITWTQAKADQLQVEVDRVFGDKGSSLLGLKFSFTIADPDLDDCPIIGCSTGFTDLCGYEMSEIVGRNCRFLVDPVPADQVDQDTRLRCRDFCLAKQRNGDDIPQDLGEACRDFVHKRVLKDVELRFLRALKFPETCKDEIIAVQRNARKDGTLFNNMFYMRFVDLSDHIGEKRYIIGLQSELPGGRIELPRLLRHFKDLQKNVNQAEELIISRPAMLNL